MSLEKDWCMACKNASQDYPKELNEIYQMLSREYKYIIYCTIEKCFVVANDSMWINKRETCPSFEDKQL